MPTPHPHLQLTSAQGWWSPIPPNIACCNLSLRILFQSCRGSLFGVSFALIWSYLPLVMLPWCFSSCGLEVIFRSDLTWYLEATLKEVELSNAVSKISELSNSSPLRFTPYIPTGGVARLGVGICQVHTIQMDLLINLRNSVKRFFPTQPSEEALQRHEDICVSSKEKAFNRIACDVITSCDEIGRSL